MESGRRHPAFSEFATAKTVAAAAAHIAHLRTISDHRDASMPQVGNQWSREYYNGEFGLMPLSIRRPAVSLVFVQSRDGNTVTNNPADLGGGPTDEHLLYEGLTRVAADGVLAGASTIGSNTFFSVWHPELVSLRASLGLPRHPAQVVISNDGRVNFEAWSFNVPEVPVLLLAGELCRNRCAAAFAARPWIHIIPLRPQQLRHDVERICATYGLKRLSVVGGRFTASRLVDAGLVQDLYLTTTARGGGKPATPWYDGARFPATSVLTRKEWTTHEGSAVFEHVLLQARGGMLS